MAVDQTSVWFTFYHHFPSKAALFAEVHHERVQSLIEAVETAVAREHEPWARLQAAFTAHLEQLLSGQAIAALTNAAILRPDEAHLLKQTRLPAALTPWFTETMAGAVASPD